MLNIVKSQVDELMNRRTGDPSNSGANKWNVHDTEQSMLDIKTRVSLWSNPGFKIYYHNENETTPFIRNNIVFFFLSPGVCVQEQSDNK